MESNCNGIGDSFLSSSSMQTVDDLLEECWFFENLFKRNAAMTFKRCNSDPCPSSSSSSSKLSQVLLPRVPENETSMEKKGDGVVHRGLVRAPSLPPCIGGRKEQEEKEGSNGTKKLARQVSHQNMLQAPKPSCIEKKEGSHKEKESGSRSKFSGQSSRPRLQRAPSLPPNIGREDISYDKDSEARMSRLIQQAFAHSTESLYPQHNPKVLLHNPIGLVTYCFPCSVSCNSKDSFRFQL